MRRVWTGVVVASAVCSGARAEVVLRNGHTIDAPVETVALAGVGIGGEAPRVLGWDLVYFSTGEMAEQVQEYEDFSDKVWRAKSRLSRGDIQLASQLYEELFERLVREDFGGPTGLVIAEGALRCRVAQGRHSDAIEAWTVALSIRETGQRQSGESGAIGVIDPQTMLVPGLAPMWLQGSPDARRFVASSDDRSASGSTQRDALLDLYRLSALQDLGEDPVVLGSTQSSLGNGGRLLDRIVRARSGDERVRAGARAELLEIIADASGSWQEAWARVAVGRSLLMEDRIDERDHGLLHLMHVPARFGRSQPHLAAIALAEAARELDSRGDSGSVDLLRSELSSRFPQHPANEWLDAVISQ